MPPKKKPNKKDEEGPDPAKINYAPEAHLGAMKERIVTEEERRDRAKASENDMRNRIVELNDDFSELRVGTKSTVDDLKRQYKDMEDSLMEKITKLDTEVEG